MARHPQRDDEAAHSGHADAQAPLGDEPLTARGQRGIRLLLKAVGYEGQRRLSAEGASATSVGTGRDLPGGAAPPKQLLDERRANPNEGREGALRAEPLLIGAENLLSQVKGKGFHAYKQQSEFPSTHMITALGRMYSRYRLWYESLEELLNSEEAWKVMKRPVPIQRAWGAIGLFWILVQREIKVRALQRSEHCGRFLHGGKQKRFCDLKDDPVCYRGRKFDYKYHHRSKN